MPRRNWSTASVPLFPRRLQFGPPQDFRPAGVADNWSESREGQCQGSRGSEYWRRGCRWVCRCRQALNMPPYPADWPRLRQRDPCRRERCCRSSGFRCGANAARAVVDPTVLTDVAKESHRRMHADDGWRNPAGLAVRNLQWLRLATLAPDCLRVLCHRPERKLGNAHRARRHCCECSFATAVFRR